MMSSLRTLRARGTRASLVARAGARRLVAMGLAVVAILIGLGYAALASDPVDLTGRSVLSRPKMGSLPSGVTFEHTPAAHLACGPVAFVYEPAGAPVSRSSTVLTGIVRASVGRWARALGRPVTFNISSSGAKSGAVVVAIDWAASFGDNVAGTGGSSTVSNRVDGTPTIESGFVTLAADSDASLDLKAGPGSWGEVLEHELGHAAGLDHAHRTGARMSTPAGTSSAYSKAERAALAWIGANPICDASIPEANELVNTQTQEQP